MELPIAIKVNGSDFDTDCAEYQRSNTEVSLKAGYSNDENLILAMKLNDNESSTKVIDSSGNGYNGTLNKNTSLVSETGKINQGFYLSTNDYVTIPNKSVYNTQSVSISFWIKLSSFSTSNCLIAKYNPTGNQRQIGVFTDSSIAGKIAVRTSNNGTTQYAYVTTNSVLENGTFHHYVIVYNSGSITIYVDGSAVDASGTVADSLLSGTSDITINGYAGGGRVSGIFDAVWWYNRALSSNEVSNLYNSGKGTEIVGSPYPTECIINPQQVDSGNNGTTWKPDTFTTVFNPNGESATIKMKYALANTGTSIPDYDDDDTAYNDTWLTLAEFQALGSLVNSNFRPAFHITGNGAQGGTVTDSSMIADVPAGSGGLKSYAFAF